MKKILWLSLILLTASITACHDETYDCFSPTDGSNLPELAMAGTYTGSFTRISAGDTTHAQGTMVFVPSDTAYCVNVTFLSTTFSLDVTCRLNCFARNNGVYGFETNDITNDLGSKIIGTISPEGDIMTNFVYKQRSGRKTVIFDYSFAGNKQ